jgi:methylglutaconyl-CoA hydratase
VHGAVFGGGVGLVAVCDVAVADEQASFALSEARMGLVPAVIAPFLLRKTGASFMRRFSLTGEQFSASVAWEHQLIHDVVPSGRLDSRMAEMIHAVGSLAPQAARQTKALLRTLCAPSDEPIWRMCVEANVQARLSAEAQEGLLAFLEKRAPAWMAVGAEQEPQPK